LFIIIIIININKSTSNCLPSVHTCRVCCRYSWDTWSRTRTDSLIHWTFCCRWRWRPSTSSEAALIGDVAVLPEVDMLATCTDWSSSRACSRLSLRHSTFKYSPRAAQTAGMLNQLVVEANFIGPGLEICSPGLG